MSNVAQENAPLLNAIGLKKYYPVKKGMFAKTQQVKALDGVSFSLERGKTLAGVGESGCGKSTLGRLLTPFEIEDLTKTIQDDKTKDFITLWEVCEYNPETFRRIVLDQDYTYKDKFGEKIDKKLLKVISKNRKGGLFAYCFNFEIDVTFNWKVYSKERVSLPYGYCKDTIYTDLNNRGNDTPDNVIIFRDAFDEIGLWICNGDNLK